MHTVPIAGSGRCSGELLPIAGDSVNGKTNSLFDLRGFVTATLLLAAPLCAQRQVVVWGSDYFNTDFDSVAINRLYGGPGRLVALGVDGVLRGRGGDDNYVVSRIPAPPAGLGIADVAVSSQCVALLSDGSLMAWGGYYVVGPSVPFPVLPSGARALDIDASESHGVAVLASGNCVNWGSNQYGECVPPVLPQGVVFLAASVSQGYWSAAICSDGLVRVWGWSAANIHVPPAAPPGTQYLGIELGSDHGLVLRSDGAVEAWGDNQQGQCNVPPLPAGLVYTKIYAGSGFSLAQRSDGSIVAWGYNQQGQCNVPQPPAGIVYSDIVVDSWGVTALRSDGALTSWGDLPWNVRGYPVLSSSDRYESPAAQYNWAACVTRAGNIVAFGSQYPGVGGPVAVPPPPVGSSYTQCSAGRTFAAALTNNGMIIAWGGNVFGELNVPSLPAGVTYVSVDCGRSHGVALRSNGTAVGWGWNGFGQLAIPSLPGGLHYVFASAGELHTFLVRSDGVLVVIGAQDATLFPPYLPNGLRYVMADGGQSFGVALRTDGVIVGWGGPANSVPALPPGVVYVDFACNVNAAVARRSDGQAVAWGAQANIDPPHAVGRSILRVAAGEDHFGGVVGSESSYVRLAQGCAGSGPVTQLIPRGTPIIGQVLSVALQPLPSVGAMLAMGWSSVVPGTPLDSVGMPGCFAYTSIDNVAYLAASGGRAVWQLPIPDSVQLLGVRFHNQALVIDGAAPNWLGAVVSDAATGLVGG